MIVCIDVLWLICDILDDLVDQGSLDWLWVWVDVVLLLMVCYGLVWLGRWMIGDEMNVLLCEMEWMLKLGQCNYGCLILIELKLLDIEWFFGC